MIDPEEYIDGAHFNELKSLFLFDRELRFLFLEYILIFENNIKTVLAHEFSKQYRNANSYLEIKNYVEHEPKTVLKQISMLVKTIHDKVDQAGAIKHYIEEHEAVPLWVLVNYLTLGNISHLYGILKDKDKNRIARFFSNKYNTNAVGSNIRIASEDLIGALKIFNFIRNKCAHDERLYNSNFRNVRVASFYQYFGLADTRNDRLFVAIVYFKVLLNYDVFQAFYTRLQALFNKYEKSFYSVSFEAILNMMGIDIEELQKLR